MGALTSLPVDMANPVTAAARMRTTEERARIDRFISALNQSMVVNGLSQRGLAARMGVESGTFTKYIKGMTDPLKVGTGIQYALAETLGVTLDSLVAFYRTGQYLNPVDLAAVESWIRSEAVQGDLPELLQALTEAGDRLFRKTKQQQQEPEAPALTPYTWPREELDKLGLPPAALERLGVHQDSLVALETQGVIEDGLVEAFALAMGLDEIAVRRAFEQRCPVGTDAS